ncbi:FAD-binding protein [Streptomyces sp. SID8379]|uniref:FAD-binding oxidoreductase n=1 Tax=unclassified Streptomyces TaxID=2593676 RepID=UPI0003788257|nr:MULTISPECIES: FAD-binding protein [unclassified Streptomyces]MYW67489.1 FAD-binding protein [Streptomyces sp. SID8379]
MPGATRRGFLGAAGAVAGITVVGTDPARAADTRSAASIDTATVTVTSSDPRYVDLTARGYNARFAARPDSIRLVHTTAQVIAAVKDAVSGGKRIAVRGGGHCLDGLVDDPDVKVLIDMSEMNAVSYDTARGAFCVEAGAQLGHVYRTLYLEWGVSVPGGTCPTVGVGGHVTGGGYGAMCRQHGAIVDHLYAVEVVVVDADGTVRSVVATRDTGDAHRDLWWAHTGGGGGNFGVVTRYWFRTPGATGTTPSALLPKPPATLLKTTLGWKWADLTEAAFTKIVQNHGAWHEANSAPGTEFASLHSVLILNNYAQGTIVLNVQLDGTLSNASALMDRYVAAVTDGVGTAHATSTSSWPWLKATLKDPYDTGLFNRTKSKGAYLRRRWSDARIAVLYDALSDPAYDGHAGILLYSYGGRVNAVAPADTAMPQRDSILKANFTTYWTDAAQDERHIAWMRALYRNLYADNGGAPTLDGADDGSYINYPDVDLTDTALNTSGTAWQKLYYKGNHARLQQVKAAYDPKNVFHHALSITA